MGRWFYFCAVPVAELCLTLSDPIGCGTSCLFYIAGIFQTRIVEWAAVSSSRGAPWSRDRTLVSCVSCTGRWILHHRTTWGAGFCTSINEQCENQKQVTQSRPTLCDPMDCSLPGSSVHGILQARILEWVAFPFSRGSSQPRDQTQVSHIVGRFFTVWATREAQECWSGEPIPSPADLHNPRVKPGFPALWVNSLPAALPRKPDKCWGKIN